MSISLEEVTTIFRNKTPLRIVNDTCDHGIPRDTIVIPIEQVGPEHARVVPEKGQNLTPRMIDRIEGCNIAITQDCEYAYDDKISKEGLEEEKKKLEKHYQEKMDEINRKLEFLDRHNVNEINSNEYQIYEIVDIFESKNGLTNKEKVRLVKTITNK